MALGDTASGVQYSLSQDTVFRARVLIQVVTVARDVYTETPPPSNHAVRAALSTKVSLDPVTYAAIFAVGVAVQSSGSTPGSPPTDGAIYSAITFLWNLYAGA